MDDLLWFDDDRARLTDTVEIVREWLVRERGLTLKPGAHVVSTNDPLVWLGRRISRAGIGPSRKLLRNLRENLRAAARRGPAAWRRTLVAYRGLVGAPPRGPRARE